jgi:hypothetical protein
MASDIDAAILLNDSIASSNKSTDDNNSSINPANKSANVNNINNVNKNGNELDYGKMSTEAVFNLAREFVKGIFLVTNKSNYADFL